MSAEYAGMMFDAEVPADEGTLFTPTTEQVMEAYRYESPTPYVSLDEADNEFKRWLATELQRARAEVLEERAARYRDTPATPGRAVLYQSVADDLERDARRIRAGGAS